MRLSLFILVDNAERGVTSASFVMQQVDQCFIKAILNVINFFWIINPFY